VDAIISVEKIEPLYEWDIQERDEATDGGSIRGGRLRACHGMISTRSAHSESVSFCIAEVQECIL